MLHIKSRSNRDYLSHLNRTVIIDKMSDNLISAASRKREELADFLKTRRAAVKPSDVGLPESPRKRTPGLRREDVAELADLSESWYA